MLKRILGQKSNNLKLNELELVVEALISLLHKRDVVKRHEIQIELLEMMEEEE